MAKSRTAREKSELHLQDYEPLKSIQREDGLWESIEKDEALVTVVLDDPHTPEGTQDSLPGVRGKHPASHQNATHNRRSDQANLRSTATQTTTDVSTTQNSTPSSTPAQPLNISNATGDGNTTADAVQDTVNPSPVNSEQPSSQPRKRRGRPPNPNASRKPRRVRFTDPITAEPEPQLHFRDSHVFIRLLKIIFRFEQSSLLCRQEYVWNKRIKGWRPVNNISNENLEDMPALFEDPTVIRALVSPTEGRGVQQSVEIAWKEAMSCFQGVNTDKETLSVTMGEMKDMVMDPWARQFVGYVLSGA